MERAEKRSQVSESGGSPARPAHRQDQPGRVQLHAKDEKRGRHEPDADREAAHEGGLAELPGDGDHEPQRGDVDPPRKPAAARGTNARRTSAGLMASSTSGGYPALRALAGRVATIGGVKRS